MDHERTINEKTAPSLAGREAVKRSNRCSEHRPQKEQVKQRKEKVVTNKKTTSDAIGRQREADCDSSKNGETTPSPAPGNTGENNSQKRQKAREKRAKRLRYESKEQPETGGIDTLEVSLCVHFPGDVFEGLAKEWDEAKERAAELVEKGAKDKAATWGWESPEGDILGVGPRGIRGGFRARWLLHSLGAQIHVSGRRAFKEGRPNVRVIIPSMVLMQRGSRQAWDDVAGVIRGMGGEIIETIVSRVDVCCDLLDVPVSKFFAHFRQKCVISDAKRWKLYGQGRNFAKPQSVYVGQNPQCRIYDKEKETRKDLGKREVMIRRRWGCEPDVATRVEFQLRRETLQDEHGIRSIEELYDKLPTVCEWCTHKFLRLCADPVEHNNHQRAEVSPLWQRVVDGMEAWAGQPLQAWVQPVKRFKAQGKHLVAMTRGVLSTHLARYGGDEEDALAYCLEILKEIAPEIQEAAGLKRDRLRFDAMGPPCDEKDIPF